MGIEVLRVVNIIIYCHLPSRRAAEHFAQTTPAHIVVQVVGNEWNREVPCGRICIEMGQGLSGTSLLVLTEQQIFYINH